MAKKRMRIAELSRESGVSRETIHYYLREGLLPKPDKSGRTSALYDDSHLERLRLIRQLRDEKYLPVAVIRELFASAGERTRDRDLATLADVLAIDPTLAGGRDEEALGAAADAETLRVALELGLLGSDPDERALPSFGPSEGRVLAAVAEALALEGDARELTLADLGACARELERLVESEAGLFFELVIESGDVQSSVGALRRGRAAVAHFITAYRDLMLRRVVEEILLAVQRGPDLLSAARTLPLGAALREKLGVDARGRELAARAKTGDPAAANDLVWLLFALGDRGELELLPERVRELLRPRAEVLLAHVRAGASHDAREVEATLGRAGAFPLGQVLLAERELARLVSIGPGDDRSFLDEVVPALHRLLHAAPERDADPLASALAFLRRGLVGLALPRALGLSLGAEKDFERAVESVLTVPGRIDPALRAFIEGNARLGLGRWRVRGGSDARAELERARSIDPSGPIGEAAAALARGLS